MAQADRALGYAALLPRFSLPAQELAHRSYLRDSAGAVRSERLADGSVRASYPSIYDPGDDTLGQLVFALKYDGVDLRVLRLVLAAMPVRELVEGIRAQPTSRYMRRLWFLYEWLFERALDVPDLTMGNYVPLFDPEDYVTGPERNSRRHRVRVNALGPASLCPVVRRTASLDQRIELAPKLEARAQRFVTSLSAVMLARVTGYVREKEARSSGALQRKSRGERFARVHREVQPMSRELLVRTQNELVEPDYAEAHERRTQRHVARVGPGFVDELALIAPTPEALPKLLDAWIEVANELTRTENNPLSPVVGAAVVSFLFVYLQPFVDGNGRLHRWLVHWAFARRGFGPREVVLPVSAAILRDRDRYESVLASLSNGMLERTRYTRRGRELAVTDDHVELFRHLDITAHAEALFEWTALAVDRELREEVEFLERFDRAVVAVRERREMPDAKERLFVQSVAQNRGRLSVRRRGEFAEVPDEVIAEMERAVREVFEVD